MTKPNFWASFPKPRHHEEDDHQEALYKWAALHNHEGSKLIRYMFHIPNGGKRKPKEAARIKKQGAKAGVSDNFLMIPRYPYAGLWIEMKIGKNKPTEAQRNFLFDAAAQGYATAVTYGWIDARDKIMDYLSGKHVQIEH